MSCGKRSDPFITYLKQFGYNVIRLPKADMHPLEVLSKTGGDLDRLGDLANLFNTGSAIPLPTPTRNTPASNVSGQRTDEMSMGVAFSILGNIISAMGGTKIGLDALYKDARTARFEFSEVTEDRITLIELDKYLGDADINPYSVHVAKLLEADQIYITTAVIKSRKFSVFAKRADNSSLVLKLPEIRKVVEGNITVSGQSDQTDTVTYEGAIPLAFGFQAVQLFFDNGRYTAFKPAATDTASRTLPAPALPDLDRAALLETQGFFARVGG